MKEDKLILIKFEIETYLKVLGLPTIYDLLFKLTTYKYNVKCNLSKSSGSCLNLNIKPQEYTNCILFALYNAFPYIMCTHVLGPNFRGKKKIFV